LSEIIEIGMTVVDIVSRVCVSRHRIVVRPERSTVSPFCSQLTGLTQAEVESGISFTEACRRLATQHATGKGGWASWGDYDRKQFLRQCEAASTDYPFGWRHINAKAVFATAFDLPRPVGMARALDIAGLPLEGRHHRGDDDAWNIAALVLDLADRGAWPETRGDHVQCAHSGEAYAPETPPRRHAMLVSTGDQPLGVDEPSGSNCSSRAHCASVRSPRATEQTHRTPGLTSAPTLRSDPVSHSGCVRGSP
jgi:inhibitor of KinA sporulation pathway (predicted exonuclease)